MTRFILKSLGVLAAVGMAMPAQSEGLSEQDCAMVLELGQGAVRAEAFATCSLGVRREPVPVPPVPVAATEERKPDRSPRPTPIIAVDVRGNATGERIVAASTTGGQLRVAVMRGGRQVWLRAVRHGPVTGKGLRVRLLGNGTPLVDVNTRGPAAGRLADVSTRDGLRLRVGGKNPLVDVNTGGEASGRLADVSTDDGISAGAGHDGIGVEVDLR